MKLFQPLPEPPLASPEAFAQFYEQAHLSVFRYGMVLCAGDQDEAEDLTAQAFFRAWEKRRQFTGDPAAALGWVITIARNLLIDRRRSAAIHPVEPIPDEALAGEESNVEEILIDAERLQDVLEILRDLPFPQGDIVTLRYVLGWQVKTIASHLGLAENTVSANLRRALAKVQRELLARENQPRENPVQ